MQENSNIIVVTDEDMQALKVIQKYFLNESQHDNLYMLAADVLHRVTDPVKNNPFESERDDLHAEIVYLKDLYDKLMQEKQELEKRNSEMQDILLKYKQDVMSMQTTIQALEDQLKNTKKQP